MRFQKSFILLALVPAIAGLTAIASPAHAQSSTFTSDGTGTYFSDTLDTGSPYPVDFSAITSGQYNGDDATLTITGYGYGKNNPTTFSDGYNVYTDANLQNSTITLQDNVSNALIYSLSGSLSYQFVTSGDHPELLTLSGTVVNVLGARQTFNFIKDVGLYQETATATVTPVPELSPTVHFGILACLSMLAIIWKGRKRGDALSPG